MGISSWRVLIIGRLRLLSESDLEVLRSGRCPRCDDAVKAGDWTKQAEYWTKSIPFEGEVSNRTPVCVICLAELRERAYTLTW